MRRILTVLGVSTIMMACVPAVALAHHHHSRHHRSNSTHHRSRIRHRQFGRDQTQPGSGQGQPAPTVDSFTPGASPGTGILTILLTDGSTVSGQVTSDTRIECMSSSSAAQGDEDNDGGDNGQSSGEDNGSTSNQTVNSEDGDQGSGDSGDGNGSSDDGGDNQQMCSTSSLTRGTPVAEANLEITNGGAFWQHVELVTS